MKKTNEIFEYEPIWGVWKISNFLGSGSYADVYKIIRQDYNSEYVSALKFMSLPIKEQYNSIKDSIGSDKESILVYLNGIVDNIVNEINLLYSLRGHSNIISYEDHLIKKVEDDKWHILIRMEYANSLQNYIKGKQLSQKEIIKLGIDICNALEFCHGKNILHRDIKEANIFISENNIFKLGDFGVSKDISKNDAQTRVGTVNYMAPEVINGQQYSNSADIYSLGIVLYKLLNKGRMPFLPKYPEYINQKHIEQAFIKKMSKENVENIEGVESYLNDILTKACAADLKVRYKDSNTMKKDLLVAMDKLNSLKNNNQTNELYMENNDLEEIIDNSKNNTELNSTIDIFSSSYNKNPNRKNKSRKTFLPLVLTMVCIGLVAVSVFYFIQKNKKTENRNDQILSKYETTTPVEKGEKLITNDTSNNLNQLLTDDKITSFHKDKSISPTKTHERLTTIPDISTNNTKSTPLSYINLLKNPGGESGLVNWNNDFDKNVGAETTSTSKVYHSGNKSFELKKSVSDNSSNYLAQIIKVTSGKKYKYSGYVKTVDVKGKSAGIWLYYYSKNEGRKWVYPDTPKLLTGTNNWKNMMLTIKVPSDVDELHVIVGIYGNGTLYADDLTLIEYK